MDLEGGMFVSQLKAVGWDLECCAMLPTPEHHTQYLIPGKSLHLLVSGAGGLPNGGVRCRTPVCTNVFGQTL